MRQIGIASSEFAANISSPVAHFLLEEMAKAVC